MKTISLLEVHETLYEQASQVLKQHNPCQWKNGNCAAGTHGCCQGCPHLGPTGCQEKSLSCRVWLCDTVAQKFPAGYDTYMKLQTIKRTALSLGLSLGFRIIQKQEVSKKR